jgi:hypothetical protein
VINKDKKTLYVPPGGVVFGKAEIVAGRDGKAIRFQK